MKFRILLLPFLSVLLLFLSLNIAAYSQGDRSMDADAYVLFSLDERGIATGITMKPVSPLTDFSYDFQDLDFHREK